MTDLTQERPAGISVRADIFKLEDALAKVPGAVFGDSELCPLKHSFAEGIYVREIFIPKGTVMTGKIHKHSHPNFLMKGEVIVFTEHGGREHLKAPLSMVSKAGTKRAVYAVEDTVWITVHATEETDLQKIEDYVIAKTYDELEAPKLASEIESKNCLILALKEKGRDYGCLLDLPSQGTNLPFKQALSRLREHNVNVDDLFCELQTDGVWHVTTIAGIPLDLVSADDFDESTVVGAWAAVAAAAVGAGTAIYGASQSGSGGGASAPPVDANQVALEQQQLQLLKEAEAQGSGFADQLASQYGYNVKKTPKQIDNPDYIANQNVLVDLQNTLAKGPTIGGGSRMGSHGGGGPQYYDYGGLQWTKSSLEQRIQQQIDGLAKIPKQNASTTDFDYAYTKTPERQLQDQAIQSLQFGQLQNSQKAMQGFNAYLDYLNSDDYKAYQKQQQDVQSQQAQIALLQGQRQKQALEGKLPLSQGTIDKKAADFQLLKENLARSGNAVIGDDPSGAYSLSSPGEQALKEFNSRYASIEDLERQGQLNSGSQAYGQAVSLTSGIGQTQFGNLGALSTPGGYALTSPSMMAPGATPYANNLSLVQGYGSAMTPYLQQQQLANQNNLVNSQISAQNSAGWMQLGGTLLGAAGNIYGSGGSSSPVGKYYGGFNTDFSDVG